MPKRATLTGILPLAKYRTVRSQVRETSRYQTALVVEEAGIREVGSESERVSKNGQEGSGQRETVTESCTVGDDGIRTRRSAAHRSSQDREKCGNVPPSARKKNATIELHRGTAGTSSLAHRKEDIATERKRRRDACRITIVL